MEEIEKLLSESSLVTLSGAGGVGKTRLALQVAAKQLDDFPDGVFLCDLARVIDPQGVPAAAANAVGFGVEAAVSFVSLVSEKQLLLILDNCEHLIESCAELCQSILAGAPNIQILATSREPLKVEGEINYVVPSLPVPPEDAIQGVEGLAPYAASELFLDRAHRARSDFALDDEGASYVAEICRRLDGIPLAIELAAARVRVLSPKQIAEGLNERFRLLTGGARTAVPRQQTLTASVDWSYDLLTDLERTVLRRLSVFVGGFSLEAAQDVCSTSEGHEIASHQVVDLLSLLVEKSLVNMSVVGGQSRYTLLETIKQYAAARLAEDGEEDDARGAHRNYYLRVADALSVEAQGPQGEKAFDAFLKDRENFEAAFRWSLAQDDFEHAAKLYGAAGELLQAIWVGEAMAWMAPVIANIDKVSEPARTDVLFVSAPLLTFFGPQGYLEPTLRGCIEFHRGSGDDQRLGRALLAWMQLTEERDEVIEVLDEAIEVTERSGDLHAAVVAKSISAFHLGVDALERRNRYLDDLIQQLNGTKAPLVRHVIEWRIMMKLMDEDPARAVALSGPFAENLAELSSLEKHSLTSLPRAFVFNGRIDKAVELADKLIPERRDVGDLMCFSLLNFVHYLVAEDSGDSETASAYLQTTIEAYSKTGFPTDVWELFEAFHRLGRGEIDAVTRVRDRLEGQTLYPASPAAWHLLASVIDFRQGEIENAEGHVHEALASAGVSWSVLDPSFVLLAAIAAVDQSYVEAARLLAGAAAYRDQIELRWSQKVFRDIRDETLTDINEALSSEVFEQAWAEGSGMTIQQTIAYAQRGRGERKRPPSGWRSLTPTEQQVVGFLAQGLSNKDVADKMFVSLRTITTHLTHIYSKLGVSTRTELVALATKRST